MKNRSNYWKLLPYVKPHRWVITQALLCIVGYVASTPVLAYLAGNVAILVGAGKVTEVAQLTMICALVFLFRSTCQYGQNVWMAKAALSMALDLRIRVHTHLQTLGLDFFETSQTGDLSYRLTEDVDRVGEVVGKVLHHLIPASLHLTAILLYMVYLNWQLTLTTLIVAPVMALLVSWFGQRLLVLSRRSQNQVSDLSALLTEAFSNIRLVKALAAEPYEIQRFSQTARGNWQAKYLAERVKAIQVLVVGFLEALGVLLLLLLGGWQIAQGNLTGQGFVSFMVAVLALIDPISFGTSGYNEFKQGEASVDRVFELFERQPSVIDKPGTIALPPVTGKVEYRNVCFAYNAEKPILQNFSLLARPGQAIALVGTSGAGKTTLINLLLRFYDPSAGRILIDGVDIQAVTLQSLRRQIGLVPQETILFSGTIAQNIAFGQDDFELEAVEAAARVANAHGFITQFPDGYYTWVGERGVNLSGGQRQRLAIARAVFRNPRILILDEATSALDSESETLVQQALEQVMVDRTVFIIAHRLATVRRCDRILVLEQGQIIESGTHADLLTKNGRYAQFYAQQFSQ